MRKICILLILSVGTSLFASDKAEMWSRLYGRSVSIEQRTAVMERMIRLDDPSLEMTFTAALEELINGPLLKYSSGAQQYSWEALVRMSMNELAQFQAIDSAYLLWQIVETNPGVLKGDAIMALGDMKALDYSERIALVLQNLNLNSGADKNAAEIEAYASIYALGQMKQTEGFEPVFFAHVGWYSRRTRSLAERVLSEMLDDPSDQILEILKKADYKDKMVALDVELASSASSEGKEKVIVAALADGVNIYSTDPSEQTDLYPLRIKALTACFQLGVANEESLEYLERAYDEATALEERIQVVQALGVNGSDKAVTLMAEWLSLFHERMATGLNPSNDEITLITQLIYGLELTKNPLAKPVLSEIELYGYSNKINRAAAAALKKF